MKQKLVYILPELSQTSHMKYNAEFIRELTRDQNLDIRLIVERGGVSAGSKDSLGVSGIYYTGNTFAILRIIKLNYFLIKARLEGFGKVYVHYSFAGALVASLIPGTKVYYWNCGMPFAYKRSWFTDWYQKLVYRRIDYFVTGTSGLLEKYSKFYNFTTSKGLVIPNWIDVSAWQKELESKNKDAIKNKYNIEESKTVIFSNQRLSERKGAHYLASITESLPENAMLVVSNDGPYKEKLIKEIEQKNCKDRIMFVGKLNAEGIKELFAITDIFILPSDEEGMSHSLLEAMATGVPIVAYDVGANKEMMGDISSTYVVQSKDSSSFTLILMSLVRNLEARRSAGAILSERVTLYDRTIATELFRKHVIIE